MILEISGIVVGVSIGVAAVLYVVQVIVPHGIRREHNDSRVSSTPYSACCAR